MILRCILDERTGDVYCCDCLLHEAGCRVQAPERDSNTLLRFPGRVRTDATGQTLHIADTGHNRVIVCDLNLDDCTATAVAQIGSGRPGCVDGPFEAASFNAPQGLAYHKASHCLYVADTGNDCLRRVDLAARAVSTVPVQQPSKRSSAARLSPWALQLDAEQRWLYVTLAGQHQIWRMHLESGAAEWVSGEGAERNQNGGSGANTAWAQPSGLALCAGGQHMCGAQLC